MIKCIVCDKELPAKECCTWEICAACHGGIEDVQRCNRENALTEEQQKTVRENRTEEAKR